jgi:PTH1 family peptidyl-tRNA hydrolase
MKAVVGLGNPGSKYLRTRHNIGFEVLAELARRHAGTQPKLKFDAELVEVTIAAEKTLLVAPQTYMNASGRAVRRLVDFYELPLSDLLVVCDDINLDVGRLRWRRSGSAGGQKGLNDIINHLGTQEIARLRIGIGRPPGQMDAADYVLSRFGSAEKEDIEHAIVLAADGVELWIAEGIEAAMNRYNAPLG